MKRKGSRAAKLPDDPMDQIRIGLTDKEQRPTANRQPPTASCLDRLPGLRERAEEISGAMVLL